jgi:enamine deaminase RidA (YjgF/YER057c/UK114 family)
MYREESEIITHDDAAFATVAYLKFIKCRLESKTADEMTKVSDVVRIPNWKESWEKYDQVVDSMSQADKTISLPQYTPLVDVTEESFAGYIAANRGQYCAISGTTAYTDSPPTAEITSIQEETKQCMKNVENRLKDAGQTWDNVLLIQVYVVNMANQVYKTFFDINPPPR